MYRLTYKLLRFLVKIYFQILDGFESYADSRKQTLLYHLLDSTQSPDTLVCMRVIISNLPLFDPTYR